MVTPIFETIEERAIQPNVNGAVVLGVLVLHGVTPLRDGTGVTQARVRVT